MRKDFLSKEKYRELLEEGLREIMISYEEVQKRGLTYEEDIKDVFRDACFEILENTFEELPKIFEGCHIYRQDPFEE